MTVDSIYMFDTHADTSKACVPMSTYQLMWHIQDAASRARMSSSD